MCSSGKGKSASNSSATQPAVRDTYNLKSRLWVFNNGVESSLSSSRIASHSFYKERRRRSQQKGTTLFLSGGLWPFEVMGTGLGGSGDTASSNSVSQGFDGNVQVVQLGAKRL